MTYKIKYTLCFSDGSSANKEINIKNRYSEYEACTSLDSYLKRTYANYKSHVIDSCEEILSQSKEGEEQLNFLKGLFNIK